MVKCPWYLEFSNWNPDGGLGLLLLWPLCIFCMKYIKWTHNGNVHLSILHVSHPTQLIEFRLNLAWGREPSLHCLVPAKLPLPWRLADNIVRIFYFRVCCMFECSLVLAMNPVRNLAWQTGYREWCFRGFSQSLQTIIEIAPRNNQIWRCITFAVETASLINQTINKCR